MRKKDRKKNRKKIPLYLQILLGMILGVAIGFIALQIGKPLWIEHWIKPWGKIFIRLLQLIAMPLVFVSLIKGVIGLKDVKQLSKLGLKTISLYLMTTVCAIIIGVTLALTIKPGAIIDNRLSQEITQQYSEQVDKTLQKAEKNEGPLNFLFEIVPDNIVKAFSDNTKMLQVIFFALLLGIATLSIGKEKGAAVINFIDSLYHIILRMIDYVIKTAPIGVAALMAGLVVDFAGDLKIFGALGLYALVVIAGLLMLMFLFYPLLVRLFTKIPVGKFLRKIYPVQLLAFTTSSSAATLPLTMETAEKEVGISEETASFVLPVGVTINMDGTSCFQAISVIFIAQVLGLDLSVMQILTIILMTTISSIGTPGIPGGSYVILTMVLTSVGIPPQGMALILGVDRPLDMLRTSVNVTGDLTVAAIVDKGKEFKV